jgi:hypothetical protein
MRKQPATSNQNKPPATSHQQQGSQRLRFVDEHNWNVVLNVILQTAIDAHELLLLLTIFQFAFALGAGQNLEQFLIEHKKDLQR